MKKKIDEEKVSADCLSHFLFCNGALDVIAEPNKNDPPDYWFTIDGFKFAVEITSIVNDQSYLASLKNFIFSLEKQLNHKNQLIGTYQISVTRMPTIPPKNSKHLKSLVNYTCSIIESQYNLRTSKTDIMNDPNGIIQLLKINANGNKLGFDIIPPMKWAHEYQNEYISHIQNAIKTKERKMINNGIDTNSKNNVLILYDALGYGEEEDIKQSFLKVKHINWFHSIFWASAFTNRKNQLYPDEPGREGFMLYSKNRSWI